MGFLLALPMVVFLYVWREHRAYTLQELSAPGCLDTKALALNDRRQVVGWCSTASVPIQAVLWQNGAATKLGTLGGHRSQATGINKAGQIVGAADTRNHGSHAFLWQQGRMRDLGTLGGRQSEARAINAQGDVAGWAETTQGKRHAFLWHNGRMRDLGTPEAESSEATAINNRGQVVGWIQRHGARHAFLWQQGQMRDLGTLGGLQSEADAINDKGWIVGSADTIHFTQHAFRCENGAMTDLDAREELSGASGASGINAQGQIVGSCSGLLVDGNNGAEAAFYLQEDRLALLRRLLPKAPGYSLKEAIGINDRGDIAVNATSGTHCHALFITSP